MSTSPNNDPATLEILQNGEFTTCELTPLGSNYTFLSRIELGDCGCFAIYKPRDGEVPLWDFPSGTLYKREVAAYLLSEILGWDFIPLTIIRDGPYGIGSVQLYVDHDPRQNYHTMTEADADGLRLIACYDLVSNNTDRKANHLLVDPQGKIWGIDQGLCFHADTKIRTCIWDFCGDPIPAAHLESLEEFYRELAHPKERVQEFLDLLLPEEVEALGKRVRWVLSEKIYPGLPGRRRRGY